jgi:hypothetical protein
MVSRGLFGMWTEKRPRVAALVTASDAERKALQPRRAIVARQRELLSGPAARKEKKKQSRRSSESRLAKYDESRRAVEDARKRDIEHARAEIQQCGNEGARQLAQSLRERGNLKVDINVSLDTFECRSACVNFVSQDVENLNTVAPGRATRGRIPRHGCVPNGSTTSSAHTPGSEALTREGLGVAAGGGPCDI